MKISQNDIAQLPVNRTAQDMAELLLSANLSINKEMSHQCDNCSKNQAINWCEKCAFHYCDSCTKEVHSIKALQLHTIIPSLEKVQSFCMDHSDERFKYWCNQCEVLVCRDCLLLQHKDHIFLSLKDASAEAKRTFQETVKEIDETKRNLTTFSDTTNTVIKKQRGIAQQQKQDIEQMFANLQKKMEERKCVIVKQLEDNESQTMNILNKQQSSIDQHLNLTIVRELCIKKMLDSKDAMQILKLKSILSHNYKDFTERYKIIDEGCTITRHKFAKDDKDVEQILEMISTLGRINSESCIVIRDDIKMKTLLLDISKPDGETKFTVTEIDCARGYKFSLKQPIRLGSFRIQSSYIGQHIGLVIDEAGIVVLNGTIYSNDSTMKWLSIRLNCDIKNNYTVLVWAPSGNGSYTYKDGDSRLRTINQNCSVESKYVQSVMQSNVGSKMTIHNNTYSIDMILEIKEGEY